MSPTHATKGTRRYAYYFAGVDTTTGAQALRLPAAELEETIVAALRELLDNPLRLSEHFSSLPVRETQRLLASAKSKELRLTDLANPEARALLRSMVRRITVQDGELCIQIERASLVDEIPDLAREEVSGEPITLSVPFEIKRRGREVRLVVTGGSPDKESVSSLVRAVAMARDWAERIAAGEIFELNQLAREYGIERSYAQKVLRCVALSPQIVEAILNGQHDSGLTFAGATANIPLHWDLQRLGSLV